MTSSAPHPSVIFLPGITGDPNFWRPVGDRLPAPWPKVYLGWPGLGSERGTPPLESVADMVASVERHLGNGADLVAQSMGGVIAVLTALRNGANVRRLVLAATSGGLDMRRWHALDWRTDYREQYPQAPAWIYEPWPDLTEQLPRLNQKALLLWSDSDPISPPTVGRHLQSLLPHSALEVVSGGSHAFAKEQADKIAPLIEKHLS